MEQKWLYGIIGLLAGVLIAIFTASNAVNNNNQGMMQMMGMRTMMSQNTQEMSENNMHSMMDDMSSGLEGKTGEAFDRAFISEMIVHHQGAIDMANIAKTNAFHQEIKDLAEDIITAQTKEIDMMKMWQKDWSY